MKAKQYGQPQLDDYDHHAPPPAKQFREPFWSIPRWWSGQRAFIVAGGPSLRKIDLDQLSGHNVICINHAHKLVPFADMVYFNDGDFWKWHKTEVLRFPGMIVTPWRRAVHPRVKIIRHSGKFGIETTTQHAVRMTASGLFAAMNIAYLMGSRELVLVGVDLNYTNGRTHFYEGADPLGDFPNVTAAERFADMFEAAEHVSRDFDRLGVSVFNVNPHSALKAWPYYPLKEFL